MTKRVGEEPLKPLIQEDFRDTGYIYIERERHLNKNKGFTLAELLIVVVVIAVLVAISIPIFSKQLHKARVATDWANIRAYYSEIQTDYISTGKQNPNVNTDWHSDASYDWKSITFLDGHKVRLKAGICAVNFNDNTGYSIVYDCNKSDTECRLSLPVN